MADKVNLEQELEDIQHEIDILEYGDDFLFTNRNGNLPRYRQLCEIEKELEKQLRELGDSNAGGEKAG